MRTWLWPMIILSGALLMAFSLGTDWAVRPISTFGFIIFCPGMAVVRFMQLTEPLTELGLAVTISLGITMLGLEIMLYLHLWSSLATLWVLVGWSIVGATLQLIVAIRNKFSRTVNKESNFSGKGIPSFPSQWV